MIVSEPVKVNIEIEDKQTGCTYLYQGANINDCIQYFQSMFFGKREYKILNSSICEDTYMEGQTCGKCEHRSKRSKVCQITTRCRGYHNICNCGQFKSLTPNWDSLENIGKEEK